MQKIFKGRALIPGDMGGPAVVSPQGLNTLATFTRTILMRSKKGRLR